MRKIYFFHIPKTAGTSVLDLMAARIGDGESVRADNVDVASACALHPDAALIAGHAYFVPHVPLPQDRYLVTLLRDPVERALSAYYFFRRPDNMRGEPNVDAARSLSLEEWVDSEHPGASMETRNYQTRLLASLEADPGADDAALLAAAKRTLERFDLAGAVDALPDWIDLLCLDLGWVLPDEIPRTNATRDRPAASDLPARALERLRAHNALDLALVAHARTLLVKRRRDAFRHLISERSGPTIANPSAARPRDVPTTTTPPASNAPAAPLPARVGSGTIEIVACRIAGELAMENAVIAGDRWNLEIELVAHEAAADVTIGFQILNAWGRVAYATNSRHAGFAIAIRRPGTYRVAFAMQGQLGLGMYHVGVSVHAGLSHLQHCYDRRDRLLEFSVVGSLGGYFEGYLRMHPRLVVLSRSDPQGLDASPWTASTTAFRTLDYLNAPIERAAGTMRVAGEAPIALRAGSSSEILVDVRNDGRSTWPAIGLRPVNLSYRWLDADRAVLVQDGVRTPLPTELPPGESVQMWTTVVAPQGYEGPATLVVTPVQEGVRWLADVGGPSVEIPVAIEP